MKRRDAVFLALPFCLLALFTLVIYGYVSLHPLLMISPLGRLIMLFFVCLCIYAAGRLLSMSPELPGAKIMYTTFFLLFLLYWSLLLIYTLFDPAFGRSGGARTIFSDPALRQAYLQNSVNLVPFATVSLYVAALQSGSIPLREIAVNLLGNLAVMTPMALFLPILAPKCRRAAPLLLRTALSVAAIELLQMVFVTGACDIDDLILGVLGTALAYLLLFRTPLRRVIAYLTEPLTAFR